MKYIFIFIFLEMFMEMAQNCFSFCMRVLFNINFCEQKTVSMNRKKVSRQKIRN